MRTFVVLLFFIFTVPSYAQIEVQMKDLAVAHARQVKLKDIAVLQDASRIFQIDRLNEMVVAVITHYDQPLRIESEQLRRVILRQQPGLSDKLKMAGAGTTTVTMPSSELSPDEVRKAVKTFLSSELAREMIHTQVTEVKIKHGSLLVPKGKVELKARHAGSTKFDTRMNFLVDVFIEDKRTASLPVTAFLYVTLPAYHVIRSLKAGDVLASSNYEISDQQFDRDTRLATLIDSNVSLVNVRAKRNLPSGTLLRHEDIEEVPHIVRNQEVVAEVSSNGILVEKPVIAQADGYLGQTIRVSDSRTDHVHLAKVVAHGRVEVK